jgi:hypothetical protein
MLSVNERVLQPEDMVVIVLVKFRIKLEQVSKILGFLWEV